MRNLDLAEMRRRKASPLETAEAREFMERDRIDPAELLERREAAERVTRNLEALPSSWSEVLFLREGAGLSYREIAHVTDRSEDVIRVTLFRARRRLRELSEPADEEDMSHDRDSTHVVP